MNYNYILHLLWYSFVSGEKERGRESFLYARRHPFTLQLAKADMLMEARKPLKDGMKKLKHFFSSLCRLVEAAMHRIAPQSGGERHCHWWEVVVKRGPVEA